MALLEISQDHNKKDSFPIWITHKFTPKSGHLLLSPLYIEVFITHTVLCIIISLHFVLMRQRLFGMVFLRLLLLFALSNTTVSPSLPQSLDCLGQLLSCLIHSFLLSNNLLICHIDTGD